MGWPDWMSLRPRTGALPRCGGRNFRYTRETISQVNGWRNPVAGGSGSAVVGWDEARNRPENGRTCSNG